MQYMASAPEHVGRESNRLGVKQLSCRALFVATFFAACFARFVRHYGIGVLPFVGGPILAGMLASFFIALTVAIVDLIVTAASGRGPASSLVWTRFARCIVVGFVG